MKPEPEIGKRVVSKDSFVEHRKTMGGKIIQIEIVTVVHSPERSSSPPKTKKRIVSKGEYLTRISKKAALRLGSIGILEEAASSSS